MQEYNSPEEYIKDVQRYIRWSRAKVVATRELSDHINDQYDALRENGLNQKEAMRKAIEEMGDADVVGTELDIVHRPKVNWLLLLIAGVLLLSGILISALSDIGVLPNFFMCVPFVVTGGMFIIYDMALVGIILSVNRNESIAKDWIKLKSKRNAAKNGGQL